MCFSNNPGQCNSPSGTTKSEATRASNCFPEKKKRVRLQKNTSDFFFFSEVMKQLGVLPWSCILPIYSVCSLMLKRGFMWFWALLVSWILVCTMSETYHLMYSLAEQQVIQPIPQKKFVAKAQASNYSCQELACFKTIPVLIASYSFSLSLWWISHYRIKLCRTVSATSTTYGYLGAT